MAGEAPKFQANELYIGVLDFFAVLLPGVVAATLVLYKSQGHVSISETWQWVALLVIGYILGHLLHAIGGLLFDPLLYDPLFKPNSRLEECPLFKNPKLKGFKKYRHENCNVFAYASALIEQSLSYNKGRPDNLLPQNINKSKYSSEQLQSRPVGIYKWARAWLQLNNKEAAAQLERLEADSKLFRSLGILVPVSLVIAWTGPCAGHKIEIVVVAAIALLLVLWRYCDLRQKSVRTCYLYFVQLYSAPRT